MEGFERANDIDMCVERERDKMNGKSEASQVEQMEARGNTFGDCRGHSALQAGCGSDSIPPVLCFGIRQWPRHILPYSRALGNHASQQAAPNADINSNFLFPVQPRAHPSS